MKRNRRTRGQRWIWQLLDGVGRLLVIAMLVRPTTAAVFTWEPAAISETWEAPINWAGPFNEFPDGADDIAVISGANANYPHLNFDQVVGSVTITGGASASTGNGINNYFLGITNTSGQSGTLAINGTNSRLRIFDQSGWDMDVDYIVTENNGLLDLRDSADVIVDERVTNNGRIQGHGSIFLSGSNFSYNDGEIAASQGALQIDANNLAEIDLDGENGGGRLVARVNSALIIDAALADSQFDSQMEIWKGGEIQINESWRLRNNINSQLWFRNLGVTSNPSVLSGSAVDLDSEVLVSGGVEAQIQAPSAFGPNANVMVDTGASLRFDNTASVENPSLFQLAADSHLMVNSNVSMGTGTGNFNWDGDSSANTTIYSAGHLDIDVDQIDEVNDRFDGEISIHSGELSVQTSADEWQMDGVLQLINDNVSPATVNGSLMRLTGDLNASGVGQSQVRAAIVIDPVGDVTVQAGAVLLLDGSTTRLEGGTWTGEGLLRFDGDINRVANTTTIQMPMGQIDLDGNNLSGSWILEAPLNLNAQSIDFGDSFDEDMQISGQGRLNLQLTSDQEFVFTSDLSLFGAGPGFTALQLQGNGMSLDGNTTVSGRSASQSRLRFRGAVNLVGNSELRLQGGSSQDPNVVYDTAVFSGGGDLRIAAGSQLNVQAGAAMDVVVFNDGRFEPGLEGVATVVLGNDFRQSAGGTLAIELGGIPGPGGSDRVQVAGGVALHGDVEVATEMGFIPMPGDVYTIMTYASRISSFDSLSFDLPNAITLDAELQYGVNAVFLNILNVDVAGDFDGNLALDCSDIDALVTAIANGDMSTAFDLNGDSQVDTADLDQWLADAGEVNIGAAYLPGDANLDGFVDVSDFGIWNNHKFTDSDGWCQGDFNADGVTDVSDFGIWNSHKFSQSDLAMVPEPSSLVLGGLGVLILLARRRS